MKLRLSYEDCICLYAVLVQASASLISEHDLSNTQQPLTDYSRQLRGKFLHITDIHPDPFYQVYSSADKEAVCHRSRGSAGAYGTETSDCDTPYSLIDATFQWINENLRGDIDFIVWTGDSARHDNDEKLPRNERQVLDQNQSLVDKFNEFFGGSDEKSNQDYAIPIVPTFGNNDVLPHNIFTKGPNKWTKAYGRVWRPFIPEEQRHQFNMGGWFYVEVIPNKLAVFSLNTMYFFDKNAAVDGCAFPEEPGYEQMEWLRIQLEFLRRRSMKAIISGHVPPARNDDKANWDETCWQKYALWMRQYRDVIVGSLYGHMNVDHFVLQDFHDIDFNVMGGSKISTLGGLHVQSSNDQEIGVTSTAAEYLFSLRKIWSNLPNRSSKLAIKKTNTAPKGKESEEQKYNHEIGGRWAERFSVSHISASVVPTYFPTIRVFEYNVTGLDNQGGSVVAAAEAGCEADLETDRNGDDNEDAIDNFTIHNKVEPRMQFSKRPKKPKFTIPRPPSKASPPGPAYSPQTFSWIGYTQYFANLTRINNDFAATSSLFQGFATPHENSISVHGKHHDQKLKQRPTPHPLNFSYEIEYDTRNSGDAFGFGDGLTVRKWVELASRIGEFKPRKGDRFESAMIGKKTFAEGEEAREVNKEDGEREAHVDGDNTGQDDRSIEEKKKKKKKKKKHKNKHHHDKRRRRITNRTWYAFVERALVGTLSAEELHREYGQEGEGS